MANETETDDLNSAIADAMHEAEFPDLKSIICEFMRLAGGAEGVARMLKKEYLAAKKGSMIRGMILQMILNGANRASKGEQARDVDLMTDADLTNELNKVLGKVNGG